MRPPTRVLLASSLIALVALAAACGGDKGTSVGRGANRTVDVTMTDNAYQPADFRVSKGETVTFKFKNNGTVKHEAILGDNSAQMRHHDQMTATTAQMEHGNMSHGTSMGDDGDGDAITVEPGKTGDLTHTFNESG